MITICGIVGISFGPDGPSAEDWTPSEMMQLLLPAAVHRGPHAYGWMYARPDGSIHHKKYVGRSDSPVACPRMNIPDDVLWVVGHVRYATHGSPKKHINNHPVQHGQIIGVHNGVLRNHDAILAETGREDDRCEVDSEAIFAAVSAWGHRKGLNRVDGDMVAVYTNRDFPRTLHIARKFGRSLFLRRTAGGALMFASESRIMDATGVVGVNPDSPLSAYRLIRVKKGKIYERIDLEQQWASSAHTRPSRQSDIASMDRREVVSRRWEPGEELRAQLRRANEAEEQARRTASLFEARATPGILRAPPTKDPESAAERSSERSSAPAAPGPRGRRRKAPAASYSRSQQVRDGDRVGTKIFYKGLLITPEEFEATVSKKVSKKETK